MIEEKYHKKSTIGQEMSELTSVEIAGCEVYEAGSPLALDNGEFTIASCQVLSKNIKNYIFTLR